MKSNTTNTNIHQKYTEFWSSNIQKLGEMHKSLDKSICRLEEKYIDFEEVYLKIENDLNLLSTIYSNYNSIEGKEHIFKLRTIIKKYRQSYTRDGIDFDLLYFLISKIIFLCDKSFEDFPLLNHKSKSLKKRTSIQKKISQKKIKPGTYLEYKINFDYKSTPYKWISFYRNESWFIIPYKDVSIYDYECFEILHSDKLNTIKVKINSKEFDANDFFAITSKDKMIPKYFIQINNGERTFAADKIGKNIYSKKNTIKPMIKRYSSMKNLSPGRVRLFGENLIYLL